MMIRAQIIGVNMAGSKISCLISPTSQSICCLLSIVSISLLLLTQPATSAQLDKQQQQRNDTAVAQSDYMSQIKLNQSTDATTASATAAAAAAATTTTITIGGKDTASKTMALSVDGSGGATKLPSSLAATEQECDDTNNTTLIIDYDQQRAYNPTPPAASPHQTGGAPTQVPSAGGSIPEDTERADETELLLRSLTTLEPAIESGGEIFDGQPRAAKLIVGAGTSEPSVVANQDDGDQPAGGRQQQQQQQYDSLSRASQNAAVVRDMRNARPEGLKITNETDIYQILLRKKPYSKYWSVEQKWDDIFKRFMAVKDTAKQILTKNLLKDIEYYADVQLSDSCAEDLKYIQSYQKKSSNFRWLMHMLDSTGKSEAGMLTGNLAALGHVVQCVKVRAPTRPSNDSFDERYFERQTAALGERFRGKYCLASVRPVLPEKPALISRFSRMMNDAILSNISYMGESPVSIKSRLTQMLVPKADRDSIDRLHQRLDQLPFESELYEYLIRQRNFMYSLPRFMGVCYPSSCNKRDIQLSLQKAMDDQHQVVDIEFECEQEEVDAWEWFTTPRLIVYVFLFLVVSISFAAAIARYLLVDRMGLKATELPANSRFANIIGLLDIMSMDKCAGILFVKTKRASPMVDWSKVENNRSTSIDALRGFLILVLAYSQLVYLGCLPLPFMWAKWNDAMFPFYRSFVTQIFLNTSIWTEAFYMISAYLIGAKLLENNRSSSLNTNKQQPYLGPYLVKRYMRLVLPMVAFMTLNYVWPRLSTGFVLHDQSSKLMKPCDNYGWTNLLLFHNHHQMNETCLWPSHVSASFFQLHLISYPILLLLLFALNSSRKVSGGAGSGGGRKLTQIVMRYSGLSLIGLLAAIGLIYPAYLASQQGLVVPFLIDYIDFDNYKQVIEWTVMPTYNHLTSYMFGLALAYLVVKRRVDMERNELSNSTSSLNEEEMGSLHGKLGGGGGGVGSSFESVMSSSTQELDRHHYNRQPTNFTTTSDKLNRLKQQDATGATGGRQPDAGADKSNFAGRWLASGLATLVGLMALTASWLWNGLGQPMDQPGQTFWYMLATKLAFNLAFAYLFYKHFANRRNSSNPWMITRFLVPIGRMSLTVFYTSWLVIWFDLLTSLYQWHPSHYFVCEKFNEIIAMTLILSLFIYGCFEGTVKVVQYKLRLERLKQNLKQAGLTKADASQQGFDNYFIPDSYDDYYYVGDNGGASGNKFTTNEMKDNRQQQQGSGVKLSSHNRMIEGTTDQTIFTNTTSMAADRQAGAADGAVSGVSQRSKSYQGDRQPGESFGQPARHLSIADQYKLNAELRANYSFASIGLYESAGASADLSHPSDPQMSPTPSDRSR